MSLEAKHNSEPEMKGWLAKWTNYIKGYQKRWFVLSQGLLSYYRTPAEMSHTCRGTISLVNAVIYTEDACTFIISNGGTQTFHLRASSEVERQKWVTALELAKDRAIRTMEAEEDGAMELSVQLSLTEQQTLMKSLGAKLDDLTSCYGLILKHGAALTRSLGELEQTDNDPDSLIKQMKVINERATLFRVTSTVMIKACEDYLQLGKTQFNRWSRLLEHEHSQRVKLEEQLEQLAKQHSNLERAAQEATAKGGWMLKSSGGGGGGGENSARDGSDAASGATTNKMMGSSSGALASAGNSTDGGDGGGPPSTITTMGGGAVGGSGAVGAGTTSEVDDDEFFDATPEPFAICATATSHKRTLSGLSLDDDDVGVLRRNKNNDDDDDDDDDSEAEPGVGGKTSSTAPATNNANATASLHNSVVRRVNSHCPPGSGRCDEITETLLSPMSENAVPPSGGRPRRLVVPERPNCSLSLWSIMKNCIGKELTKIPMPVNFNEPLSTLQRLCEDYEYSELLDKAASSADHGMQLVYIAAFAVSSYSTTSNRTGKPFNPLLGETYECDRTDDYGWKCVSEQVSHHPPMLAQYCEGRGWKCWQEFTMSSKFRGKYLQIIPLGIVHLEFPEKGYHFTWRKVTTTVHNIIVGRLWVDHHGDMDIVNHTTGHEAHVKFLPYSYFSRDIPRKVTGVVVDKDQKPLWALHGTWDTKMEASRVVNNSTKSTGKQVLETATPKVIWKRVLPPPEYEKMYNFTVLACQLNEPEDGVCPTDSRNRPDQRLMEEGRWDEANDLKVKLEEKQRQARTRRQEEAEKAANAGRPYPPYEPVWFKKDSDPITGNPIHIYKGEYWPSKTQQKWDNCPDIYL